MTTSPKNYHPLLSAILWLFSFSALLAQDQIQPTSNPIAEAFTRRRIISGYSVDLAHAFQRAEDRVLSSSFLDTLILELIEKNVFPREGVSILNARFAGPLRLVNLSIPFDLMLVQCEFKESVNFSRTTFQGSLILSYSKFRNSFSMVSSKIGGDLFFRGSVFESTVDLAFTETVQMLELDGAVFKGRSLTNLNSLKVGRSLTMRRAEFNGPVNLGSSTILGQMDGSDTRFFGDSMTVSFNGISVKRGIFLKRAIFKGNLDFISAECGVQFEADSMQCVLSNSIAVFGGMKVQNSMDIDYAVFKGEANFTFVTIGNAFYARGVTFSSVMKRTSFNSIKVNGGMLLNGSNFLGGVTFGHAIIGSSLELNNTTFSGFANFTSANVAGDFLLDNSVFAYEKTDFSNVRISGTVQLINTKFYGIPILGGMNYDKLLITDGRESWSEFLKLVQRAPFHTGNYKNLEVYLNRIGESEFADEVFIAQKNRESIDKTFGPQMWDKILDFLVGYGRKPERAIYWSLVFIFTGAWVFRRDKMICRNKEDIVPQYNPVLYSIEIFLPFLNLFSADAWIPKPNEKWTWMYLRVHRFIGWILVPLGLASLTGLLK